MSHPDSSRFGTILLLLAATIGFFVGLYAWLTPLTGVTGTIGAIGVAIACVILALLTFIVRCSSGRRARIFWILLTLLMLVGIGFASALLHQYIIIAAMMAGFVGLIVLSKTKRHYAQHARV